MESQKIRRMAGIVLVLLMIPAVCLADMTAYFVDSGADHFIAVTADGKTMVLENGSDSGGDALLNWLGQAKAGKIDLWVGQGFASNQGDTVLNMLASTQVQNAWLPDDGSGEPAYKDIRLAMQNQGAQTLVPAAGTKYELGSASITVLMADTAGFVLRMEYGSNSFLLVGSADLIGGQVLAEAKDLSANVLSLSGINDSSAVTKTFLTSVSPIFAFAGGSNAQPVTNQISAAGFTVPESAADGTLTMTSDGTFVRLIQAKAYGVTIKNKVNIRTSPSANAKKIASLSKNTALTITGFTVNQDGEKWYEIDLNGNTAYVRADLLTPVTSQQLQQNSYKTVKPKAVKTPKPTVDTVSGGTRKGK